MKNLFVYLTLTVLFFTGCRDKAPDPVPFVPDFKSWKDKTFVNVNGVNLEKYYHVSVNDSIFGISLINSEPDYSYYYQIGANIRYDSLIKYFVHTWTTENYFKSHLTAATKCCYQTADQFKDEYLLNESDSLTNFFRLHLNKTTKEVSGYFQATLINDNSPYDTMHLRCDTFSCKYD